jgi:hypothetical protein
MKIIMKWEDLEPGDKVKINDKMYSIPEERYWISAHEDLRTKEILTITSVTNFNNSYISITFDGPRKKGLRFHISPYNGSLNGKNYDFSLFEIVELI